MGRMAVVKRVLAATVVLATMVVAPVTTSPASSQPATEFEATKDYVETFYPVWLNRQQLTIDSANRLNAPSNISPVYKAVVAINDDTLYTQSVLDMSIDALVVTVPETTAAYSVLTLDGFGNVYDVGIPSQPHGTVLPETVYTLTPPGWGGPIAPGSTQIPMPIEHGLIIFRADRYTPDGTNQVSIAQEFRDSLRLLTLQAYLLDPANGATRVLPEAAFGTSFKTAADELLRFTPLDYLNQLKNAVDGPDAPDYTVEEEAIRAAFDAVYPPASGSEEPFREGARAAHNAIIDNYLNNTDANGWIHFTNMGAWGNAYVDRSSLNMFIQYGNGIDTAAYYHAFVDSDGNELNGSNTQGYELTFAADEIPPAERFWSITAYTPQDVELIPNSANKWLVARYTPDLQYNADGSLSIYISETQPEGVPEANWLPVIDEQFNIMIRVYGVEEGSSVANNTYVPPPIKLGEQVPPTPTPTPTVQPTPTPTPTPLVPKFTG